MLVLSRKTDESIRIGNDIEVTVVSVRGNRVKLAISAPKEIPIQRSELSETMKWPSISTSLPANSAAQVVYCS